MSRPLAFQEDRVDVLRAAITAHPFGEPFTAGTAGLTADVPPFGLELNPGGDLLFADMAKANEQLAEMSAAVPALFQFHGPQSYVSPFDYPTKQERGTPPIPTTAVGLAQRFAASKPEPFERVLTTIRPQRKVGR